MTRREELIVQMLRSWDLLDPAAASGVRSTDGSRVPLLGHEPHCLLLHAVARLDKDRNHAVCTCFVAAMQELTRCLRLMRAEERRLWFHVHARFIAAERRPLLVHVKHGRPQLEANVQLVGLVDSQALNKRGDGIVRVLVERWNPRADAKLAALGVEWLAGRFVGSPQLPLALTKEAA